MMPSHVTALPIPVQRSFKVVFLGDSGVGKTCLAARLNPKAVPGPLTPTVGLDFSVCPVLVEGESVRANIWDTAGQERFSSLLPAYCREAHGAVLVFDLTDLKTFLSLERCLLSVSATLPDDACKLVIGNKRDLAASRTRAVSFKMGEQFAKSINATYTELSALQDADIYWVFADFIRDIAAKSPRGEQFDGIHLGPRTCDRQRHMKKSSCCF